MQVLRSVDTIAEFIVARANAHEPAVADATRPRRANVFTVDLEEWFHICGVGGALGARAAGTACPSRVEPTTRALLDLLDRAGVRATFFVVGWVAERYPRLVERDPRGRPRDRVARLLRTTRVYELGRDGFVADARRQRRARCAAPASPRVAAFARRNGRSTTDRSGRSTRCVDEGFTLDASMAPLKIVGDVDAIRAIRTCGTTPPGRFSKCRRSSPIGSGR